MRKNMQKFLRTMTGILLVLCVLMVSQKESTVEVQAATLSTPKLVSATASGTARIVVKWNSVTGASGYRLYRHITGKGWSKVKDLSGASSTSYVDSSLTPGTRYYYTVRAYRKTTSGIIWSSYNKSGVSAVTNLATPALKSAKHTAKTTVRVQWNKVTGAQGYLVYKRVNSKWVRKANVTSGSVLYWNDTAATSGTGNVYTVRAYSKNGSTYKYSGFVTAGIKSNSYSTPTIPKNTYYKQLASYIQKNGRLNSSGNRYIATTATKDNGEKLKWGIVYEPANDNFVFILTSENTTTSNRTYETTLKMNVNTLKSSYVSPDFIFLYTKNNASFETKASCYAANYTGKSNITFSIVNKTSGFTSSSDSQIKTISNNYLKSGFSGWNHLVKKAGLSSIKALGFTSYTG
jgi:hypothetical protein